jgi:hypothetical protein
MNTWSAGLFNMLLLFWLHPIIVREDCSSTTKSTPYPCTKPDVCMDVCMCVWCMYVCMCVRFLCICTWCVYVCIHQQRKVRHILARNLMYCDLQNNLESSNGFQRFSSSKLVQKSVENRWAIPKSQYVCMCVYMYVWCTYVCMCVHLFVFCTIIMQWYFHFSCARTNFGWECIQWEWEIMNTKDMTLPSSYNGSFSMWEKPTRTESVWEIMNTKDNGPVIIVQWKFQYVKERQSVPPAMLIKHAQIRGHFCIFHYYIVHHVVRSTQPLATYFCVF